MFSVIRIDNDNHSLTIVASDNLDLDKNNPEIDVGQYVNARTKRGRILEVVPMMLSGRLISFISHYTVNYYHFT